MFPTVSNTGKTLKINLIIKTSMAYFQFNKSNERPIIQFNQYSSATHCGKDCSFNPSFCARIILISKVVIDDVKKYTTVIMIIIGDSMGVLNNSILRNYNFVISI